MFSPEHPLDRRAEMASSSRRSGAKSEGMMAGSSGQSAVDLHRPSRLPRPPRPLIGRARETEAVRRLLLDGARLVTLTGPAGVGKTRLALAVAEGLTESFDGGIHVVELADIADPPLAVAAIAQSLGFDLAGQDVQPDDLVERLTARPTLIVLDNCEQVLPVGVALAQLLAACPLVRLLATSREPLRLRWEHLVSVSPLPVPDLAGPVDLAKLAAIG